MKKIYMLQPCDTHGTGNNKSAYLPYATGLLVANAFRDETICAEFAFGRFIYIKENIDECLATMEDPAVVGFSTYIWNYMYNLEFARRLKEKYPDCVTVFGGHNVSNTSCGQIDEYPFIDFLIHGEGEEAFRSILKHLITDKDYSQIPNISFRKDGKSVKNPYKPVVSLDFPSPYLEGWFDDIVENDDITFSALLETNRGCPFSCAYCDWGAHKGKILKFPLERVVAEMEWFADKKIAFCFCVDSNFGMFPEDFEIVDAFLDIKKRKGFPETFKCCTTEGSGEKEFRINKKLNDSGLLKGASLALQTLSDEALINIGRKNMSLERYGILTAMYNDAGIPTYSEMIYGLPGETYDSFADSIGFMLEQGTTRGFFIHYCELLINSALANKENVEKFNIVTAKMPYTQFHCEPSHSIEEESDIIISTYSMSYEAWINTIIFGLFVQCFHFMGLTQCIAKYMFYEKKMSFREFYEALIRFAASSHGTIIGECYEKAKWNLSALNRGEKISRVFVDSRFGNIEYPMEEGMCLNSVFSIDRFYSEIQSFIETLGIDENICQQILIYQKELMRKPGETDKTVEYKYDFPLFFKEIDCGRYSPLVKKICYVEYHNSIITTYSEEYARRIIWYGRKSAAVMYSEHEMTVLY